MEDEREDEGNGRDAKDAQMMEEIGVRFSSRPIILSASFAFMWFHSVPSLVLHASMSPVFPSLRMAQH